MPRHTTDRRRNAHAVRSLRSAAWAKSPSRSTQVAPSGSAILPTLRALILEHTMTTRSHISRRHMLALSAAAGGAAVSGLAAGLGAALAQERPRLPAEIVLTPRIDRFDPALDQIIPTSEPIREIASGFGGPLGPAEGPLWWKEGGYLLFSDINAST